MTLVSATEVNLADSARGYLAAGLCVLPALRAEKRPSVGQWKQYRNRLPTEAELSAWFANGQDALCILCGAVSGNVEMIDFDAGGELFDAWVSHISTELLAKLVIERTQRGGRHVVYRCEQAVCGNMKLAQRKSGDKVITLIETRGEGGLFLCAPTDGYVLIQGRLCNPPVLTEVERDDLLQAAWALNEYLPPVVDCPPHNANVGQRTALSVEQCPCPPDKANRPGDDFNNRGDVRVVLAQAGWSRVREGENEYWRRPGKDSGWSATLKGRVFYVFSANAAPFEPNRAYAPFSVYTLLNFGGDFEQAARSLRQAGYGCDSPADNAKGADISAIVRMSAVSSDGAANNDPVVQTTALSGEQPAYGPENADPGPISAEMLRVPGFISEVMDYCLETAPYPNHVMAFCGALSLQAFLAGRKVRDTAGNRTNIYLLGLAHSATGKDWPRRVNIKISHRVGLTRAVAERFASGEGLQDALFADPCMLFQTDEIDGMFRQVNGAQDARHESIITQLLMMYSSASTIFPMRKLANREHAVIDQPCLVLFGTAIPNHYYDALSSRMLTNGLFARMMVIESGPRSKGKDAVDADPPKRVLDTAKWWADYMPGSGNIRDWHPVPTVVEQTDEAKRFLASAREESEQEYAAAEKRSDALATTVWGRVDEQTRKLALIHAISVNHEAPEIGMDSVRWAHALITHQTKRMLFMASSYVAENPFDKDCLKFIRKLREAGGALTHRKALKNMHMQAKPFLELIQTLEQRGEVITELGMPGKAGPPPRQYRLVSAQELAANN